MSEENEVVQELRRQDAARRKQELTNALISLVILGGFAIYYFTVLEPDQARSMEKLKQATEELDRSTAEFDAKWGPSGTERSR